MLLGLSAFSTSKPQSAFSNQYVLKKTFFNLSRGEIIFEAKGLLKIMGTRKFLFLFFRDTPVFSPDKNKIWPGPWKHNSPEILRQKAWWWEQLQCWSGTGVLLIHSRLLAGIWTLWCTYYSLEVLFSHLLLWLLQRHIHMSQFWKTKSVHMF